MVGEVFKQPDVGEGEVAREEGHHLHVDAVRGLGGHGHGDDAGALPADRPVATVVDH